MRSFLLLISVVVVAFFTLQSQEIARDVQCSLGMEARQSSTDINQPYSVDANTVVLLHFDNNLVEEAHNYNVGEHGTAKTYISNPNSSLSQAIYFDNSLQSNQSFIFLSNASNEMTLSGSWTIEFWFYIESWDQNFNNWPIPIILPTSSFDANYVLEVPASEGRLKFSFTTNQGNVFVVSSANSITRGNWYHVALINDDENHLAKLLLHDSDGLLIEQQTTNYPSNVTISNAMNDLKIGAGQFSDNYFDGYIDELRISDIVRDFEAEDDRILLRSNDDFEIWGLETEEAAADTVIRVLSENYDRIAGALNTQLISKVIVDVYHDLASFHAGIGWPDAPDWVVGTATGDDKIDMVSPFNPGPVHTFESIIGVISHELVHNFVHKLADGHHIPLWLNEGTANFIASGSESDEGNDLYEANGICPYIDQNGGLIRDLDELDNSGTFGNTGGYAFSYTIVAFLVNHLGGTEVLSQFIASGLDYSLLEIENELAFQNEWHQYFYLNYPCDYSEMHAVFSADLVSGAIPFVVEFTDYSTVATAAISNWNWDFNNDGSIDSYSQNPTWTYNEPGIYSVSLTVSDGISTDTYVEVDYISVEDVDPNARILLRSNNRFEVWGLVSEDAAADAIIEVLTANYNRIADSLNVQLTSKVIVDVYPDLTSYHNAIGWPDAPDWVVGTAIGDDKIDLVSPYNPGPQHTFESLMSVITHELVHCFVHKLANGQNIPRWLNEGTATYLALQESNTNSICSYVDQNGGVIPSLIELNNGSTFGSIGGYTFGYTIAEFIVHDLGGSGILSQFIASGLNYYVLELENELAFQDEWNEYVYSNYDCVYDILMADFLADVVAGEVPLEVAFTDYSLEGFNDINDWKWDFDNDGAIDSYDQNPTWTYNEIGIHTVSLTVGDGSNTNKLTKTDYISVTAVVAAVEDNLSNDDFVSVYPNPVNSILNISSPETFTLSIFTLTGQQVIYGENLKSISIDMSEYSNGIYLINIKGKEGTTTRKLIVEK